MWLQSRGGVTRISRIVVQNNSARDQGGGILFSGGEFYLSNSTIAGNKANFSGGGIQMMDTSSLVVLSNGSRIYSNEAPNGSQIFKYGAALYEFPTPPGFYLDGSYLCQEHYCETWQAPCPQICNFSRFDGLTFSNLSHLVDDDVPYLCPLGHHCTGSARIPCRSGLRGNVTGLRTPHCAGPCPIGKWCGLGSTASVDCADGTFGNATGLSSQAQCSACDAGYWCNAGNKFPCDKGFHTDSSSPSRDRIDLSACTACPLHATTASEASPTIASCLCRRLYYMRESGSSNATCVLCPSGTDCSVSGRTLRTLPVLESYWSPGTLSTVAKPCPHASTCAGGVPQTERYSPTADGTCTSGLGVSGVYCMLYRLQIRTERLAMCRSGSLAVPPPCS